MKTQLSLTRLISAQKTFEKFRTRLGDDQLKAGAIQAFEYCFELSWKTMKKFLEIYNAEQIAGSRDAIRAAARQGIINDAEKWFEFIDARNLTAHIYEENAADEVIELFPEFSKELENCIVQIKKRMQEKK